MSAVPAIIIIGLPLPGVVPVHRTIYADVQTLQRPAVRAIQVRVEQGNDRQVFADEHREFAVLGRSLVRIHDRPPALEDRVQFRRGPDRVGVAGVE